MIPAEFDYVAPGSLDDALAALKEGGDEAKILAGGHSLIPLMKLRLAAPALLVDLRRVEELRGIDRSNGVLRFGAMVRHHEVATGGFGLPSMAAATIADQQVRNMGTIGGTIAHGDPASDLPAILLAHEGSVTVRGGSGERDIAAADFFEDYLTTSLAEDEIVTSVNLPALEGYGYGYEKFNRRQEDWAMVAVCALIKKGGDGTCADVRVGPDAHELRAAAGDRGGGGAARAAADGGFDRRGGRERGRGHRAALGPQRLAGLQAPPRAGAVQARAGGRVINDRVSFTSPQAVTAALAGEGYLADQGLATSAYLAFALEQPLLLEGEAGVGKTEVARALASATGAELIRLQCHEGIDLHHAVYDWDYQRQLLAIRAAEAGAPARELFGPEFLLRRPLLEALEHDGGPAVLLIDEIDRADDEFEAFLLEFLADFAITIPELGTISAAHRPLVVLTSNRTRELHDALKRRCLYHWIDYPSPGARGRDRAHAAARRAGGGRRAGLWGGRSVARARALQAAGRGGDDHLGAGAAGAGRDRFAG